MIGLLNRWLPACLAAGRSWQCLGNLGQVAKEVADTLRFLVDGLGKRGPCDGGIFDCVTGSDFGVSIFLTA